MSVFNCGEYHQAAIQKNAIISDRDPAAANVSFDCWNGFVHLWAVFLVRQPSERGKMQRTYIIIKITCNYGYAVKCTAILFRSLFTDGELVPGEGMEKEQKLVVSLKTPQTKADILWNGQM